MSETCNDDNTRTITENELHSARHMRLKLLEDPHRPAYHFVSPEGHALPFDPNGCVYWCGRHHMGYIYQERGVHYWGHASSADLLHWRHHTPSLSPTPDSPETGIFSGNGFVDMDGSRVIYLYHGVGAGNCIAWSNDRNLERWHKQEGNPIVPNAPDPDRADYQSWDPCGWIEGDTYYAVFGGKKNTVWKSKDLRAWEMCGPFLSRAYPGIDICEDISCPDFFPLGDKWVMVCISHRLGARYYVGRWENEQLHPEYHEMMSFGDNEFFAPESYTDGLGRRILFAWVFDRRTDEVRVPSGWSGTMSLPRVLSLGPDNRLLMVPVEELELLRYNRRVSRNLPIPENGEIVVPFDAVEENVLELVVELANNGAMEFGVKICCSPDDQEETVICYDVAQSRLQIDTTSTGSSTFLVRTPRAGTVRSTVESAPMRLDEEETLKLRVFIDRSIVEVFANDGRLALSRCIYPSIGSTRIKLYASGGGALASTVTVWDIMPTNPY